MKTKNIVLILALIEAGCIDQPETIPIGEQISLCPAYSLPTCEFALAEAVWSSDIDCEQGSFSVEVKDLPGSTIGRESLNQRKIWLDPITLPEAHRYDGAIVLAHEIGHLYGLKHSDNECDLMYSEGPMRHCGGFEINGFWHTYRHDSACEE